MRNAAGMKFAVAVDLYIADMRIEGRITSDRTEEGYRHVLRCHGEDVGNRDPRTVGREDCKRTLARWAHPNTQSTNRSVLVSFYDWAVEEGIRPASPARQTRRPKKRQSRVYRLQRDEAVLLLEAAAGIQEVRAITLGLCAGLRSAELRGLQARHFEREGYVWVSEDIAKGGHPRYVPIVEELEPLVADILSTVGDEHYVLTAERTTNPPWNTEWRRIPTVPMSAPTLWKLVGTVGERAGISAHIHPHLLRHAFGDHIAKHGGIKVAQAMMGHRDVKTTQIYTDTSTLDELAIAVRGLRYSTGVFAPAEHAQLR